MSRQEQSGSGSSSSGEGQSQTGKRTITIVTTRGQKKKTIEFEGTTWEGLKKEVERAGYDLSNMKAVEGVRRNSLEHPQALIPEGDFNLFLMPYQSKSGNERSEMYATIKKHKEKFDDAKDFFGDYTHTPSNKLKSKLKKFERTHDVGETEDSSDKEMVGKAIDDIANGNPEHLFEEMSKLSIDEKFYLLTKIVSDLRGAVHSGSDSSKVAETAGAKEEKDRLKKEEDDRIKKEKEEEEKLQNEMQELMMDMPEVERRSRR